MSEESKPEESKTPSKVNIKLHVINLVSGIVGGVACLVFVLAAHRNGLKLDGPLPGIGVSIQDALIVGAAASLGLSIYSAKKLPGA